MKYLITIFFMAFVLIASGQKKSKQPFIEPEPFYGVFGRKLNIPLLKRIKNYPFNKAYQIELVSFDGSGGPIENPVIQPGMPNQRTYICVLPFQEVKRLNSVQIDSLSDILYNFGYLEEPNILDNYKCYEPRNGILFLNKKGKVFAFVEICFDCKKIRKSARKINLEEEMEPEKIGLLKGFFAQVGVEYGTIKKFKSQERL